MSWLDKVTYVGDSKLVAEAKSAARDTEVEGGHGSSTVVAQHGKSDSPSQASKNKVLSAGVKAKSKGKKK